ncbi:MAG: hypothetical protein U1F10_05480 [Burkholderiales bacterium]
MSASFFLPGKDCTRGYANFRGMRKWKEMRGYVNRLWALYQPFADAHFREDARKHFLERYWEMYLTVACMANGAKPIRARAAGPEFCFLHRGQTHWIEAIAPNAGTGKDQVRESDPADNFRIPVEKILLRYTSALREKQRKLDHDRARRVVNEADPYIVAINSRGIPYAYAGNTLPYLLQALFPIGPLVLSFDLQSKKVTGRSYQRREVLTKQCGSQVKTTAFLDLAYSGISAVIHSAVDAANLPRRLGADFFVVHNPSARNPIPISLFAQWRQYVFEADRLSVIPPSRRTSQRHMSPDLRAVLLAPAAPVW